MLSTITLKMVFPSLSRSLRDWSPTVVKLLPYEYEIYTLLLFPTQAPINFLCLQYSMIITKEK